MKNKFLWIVLLLFFCTPAWGQELTEEQYSRLGNINQQLTLLDNLTETPEIAAAKTKLLKEAEQICGKPVTLFEVQSLVAAGPAPSWSSRVWGYINFINVLWVFVGIISLIAFLGMFGKFIAPLIVNVPVEVLEIAAWIGCIWAGFYSPDPLSGTASFIAAMIALPIAVFMLAARFASWFEDLWRVNLGLCAIYIAANALIHESMFFGGLSVLAILWLCGSWVVPFVETFDIYQKKEVVPSALASSALLLGATGVASFTVNPEWLGIFKPGIFGLQDWLILLVY
jgi:hypothetical protein